MTPALAAGAAARRIIAAVAPLPAETRPLTECLGQVLAADVVSRLAIPAHTNSAMDGYAVRGADVRGASAGAPVSLRVIEQIPAGAFPTRVVGPGECARIFTGAPLPEGSDCVIRQEDTDFGSALVRITNDRDVGFNVRYPGEDVRQGETVLAAGTAIDAAQLGVLASLAEAAPAVHRRPRVAIMGSGDEIADLDEAEAILAGRKVASSNSYTLRALVTLAGGEPVYLGIARDTPESVRSLLERGRACDLIVTTAGISVGEHDHLRSVLDAMGLALDFWKISMRPGAPVGFGLLPDGAGGRVPWIGLPGNPVSTMVTFELFVRPAIRRMLGHPLPFRRGRTVRAGEPISLKPRLQHFLRAIVRETGDGAEAVLTGPQGSGILTSMARANALLVVPEGQHETPPGAPVTAIVLDDPVHEALPPF